MTFLGPENFVRFEQHQKAFSGALRGAFWSRKVLGSFEKRTPGVCAGRGRGGGFIVKINMNNF